MATIIELLFNVLKTQEPNMLLSYDEYDNLTQYKELEEKLIMYNNGMRYGQVVFLAGGAGSGKGFAQQNFMEVDKFKVFDVDELKKAMIKVKGLDLDLRNPEDVFKLHMMVKKSEVKDRMLSALFRTHKKGQSAAKGVLPNLMFDITLKELADVNEVLPMLLVLGYKPKDVHITWVLTNYYVAVQANQERERVVPDDILLKTHVGAAKTMSEIVKGKIPRGVNGSVQVILNNRDQTVLYVDKDGNPIKGSGAGNIIVKDFTYVTLKKSGKPFIKEADVQRQIFNWISKNVPKDALRHIEEPKL
jgi:dephospho-CoA kinase